MAGLLAYAAAGAAQGVGAGLVQQALQQREAALKALEMQREDQRFATQRADRQQERTEDRAFETSRDSRNFDQQRTLAKENREYESALPGEDYVDADGNVISRSKGGTKMSPVLDDKGRPVPYKKKDGGLTDNQLRLIKNDFYKATDLGDENEVRAAIEDTLATYPNISDTTVRTWAKNRLIDGGMTSSDADAWVSDMLGGGSAVGGSPGAKDAPATNAPEGRKSDSLMSEPEQPSEPPAGMPPGAKWSPKYSAWFIQKNGKWVRLDPE